MNKTPHAKIIKTNIENLAIRYREIYKFFKLKQKPNKTFKNKFFIMIKFQTNKIKRKTLRIFCLKKLFQII